jgi:chromosome segregation ATPase
MKLQHENETLKRELNTITNENMQMKYALYNSNSNNINEVNNNNDLHNLKKTNETLLAKNASLENDLNETKDNYMQLNTLYNEVLSENENALNKVTYLFEEINNMKIEMDKLSQGYNTNSNSNNTNERLCLEMQNITQRNEQLIEENKYLNNTVKEMISNNNELNKAIEQLTTRIHEVNGVNMELTTQNEMLHKQIELLQQQQQLQQHEILTSIKP